MIPRAVFDTNILFSAIGWRGAPYQCLQAVIEGRAWSVTCPDILAELREKLESKQHMSPAEAAESVAAFEVVSETVEISGALRTVPSDPKDDMIVECALVSRAGYIVSGDRHLLELGHVQGVRVLSANDFLKMVEEAGIQDDDI